jgi:hypothetical protein
MAPPQLHHGIRARCSVLLKRLHPAKVVAKKFLNFEHGRRLSGLICLRKEEKRVSRRLQLCFVYRHDDFEGTELHCVQRWSKVENEGVASHIFGADDTSEEEEKEERASDPVVETPIPQQVLDAGNRAEDIAAILRDGFFWRR